MVKTTFPTIPQCFTKLSFDWKTSKSKATAMTTFNLKGLPIMNLQRSDTQHISCLFPAATGSSEEANELPAQNQTDTKDTRHKVSDKLLREEELLKSQKTKCWTWILIQMLLFVCWVWQQPNQSNKLVTWQIPLPPTGWEISYSSGRFLMQGTRHSLKNLNHLPLHHPKQTCSENPPYSSCLNQHSDTSGNTTHTTRPSATFGYWDGSCMQTHWWGLLCGKSWVNTMKSVVIKLEPVKQQGCEKSVKMVQGEN